MYKYTLVQFLTSFCYTFTVAADVNKRLTAIKSSVSLHTCALEVFFCARIVF